LARLGIDVFTIQALGRWGSATVARYVRDASVSIEAARSRSAGLGMALLAAPGGPHGHEPRQLDLIRGVARQAAADAMPDFARILREGLAAEATMLAQAELESSSSSSTASSSSSSRCASPPPAPAPAPQPPVGAADFSEFVGCGRSKKQLRHRVLIGPAECLDAAQWVTHCGWKFGLAGTARHPRASDTACQKCG